MTDGGYIVGVVSLLVQQGYSELFKVCKWYMIVDGAVPRDTWNKATKRLVIQAAMEVPLLGKCCSQRPGVKN